MVAKSELTVITKAKDLCGYVLTVTEKSPKRFRFMLVSRMQNLTLDAIGQAYRANEVYLVGQTVSSWQRGGYTGAFNPRAYVLSAEEDI